MPKLTEEEKTRIRKLTKDLNKIATELYNAYTNLSSWIDFLNTMIKKRSRWEEEEEEWETEEEEEEEPL
jgi:hypothetical protein